MAINRTTSDFLSTEQLCNQAGAAKPCHCRGSSLWRVTGSAGQHLLVCDPVITWGSNDLRDSLSFTTAVKCVVKISSLELQMIGLVA